MSELDAVRKIGEVIVGAGGQANIQFNTIDQAYRSLRIDVTGRGDTAAVLVNVRLQYNADTTSGHYTWQFTDFYGAGTTDGAEGTSDNAVTCGRISAASAAANVPGTVIIDIPCYAMTSFCKALNARYSLVDNAVFTAGSARLPGLAAGWWNSTAAITSILLFPASGNFVQGSVCSLYGWL